MVTSSIVVVERRLQLTITPLHGQTFVLTFNPQVYPQQLCFYPQKL